LTYLDEFHDVFKRVRRGLRLRPHLPRRLLLSRGQAGSLRISEAETALLEQVTARHGFVPLHLETLDFRAQAEALFNAECVVGVHGAGMVNILFGQDRLRVLELNLRLDGESLPRPWFYLLAHARLQKYMMLDCDAGDLSSARLDAAIESLLVSH
jgi:capsular polysaccharide biosynthesis protein